MTNRTPLPRYSQSVTLTGPEAERLEELSNHFEHGQLDETILLALQKLDESIGAKPSVFERQP